MAFTYESRDMDFYDVTSGISGKDYVGFIEYLRVDVLEKIKQELDNTTAINNSINAGWQGESRDRFLQKFDNTIAATKSELNIEFKTLVGKLNELAQSYYKQDSKMIDVVDDAVSDVNNALNGIKNGIQNMFK